MTPTLTLYRLPLSKALFYILNSVLLKGNRIRREDRCPGGCQLTPARDFTAGRFPGARHDGSTMTMQGWHQAAAGRGKWIPGGSRRTRCCPLGGRVWRAQTSCGAGAEAPLVGSSGAWIQPETDPTCWELGPQRGEVRHGGPSRGRA